MTEARRLDPTQRAAATAAAPVQLTLAGPGAGKTTTLAVRFVHLVRQGVDPRRILATFTRKAAIEMQDRIVRLLRLDGPKALYHSSHADGSQVSKSGIQACDFIYR